MNILKTFSDQSYVYYDKGRFDGHCVYLKEPNAYPLAPRDIDYFQYFIGISAKYGAEKIYSDFCYIYDRTTSQVDNAVLNLITRISASYSVADRLQVDKWFTVLYLGMVAEERKANAVLKKKIKRLGFHQIMREGFTAADAANYSKGEGSGAIAKRMLGKGILIPKRELGFK